MVTLERLRADHAGALLDFERANRAYFARTVPDRGDAFFTPSGFAERLASLLAEQRDGICHFHVILDDEGRLAGRINLMDVADGRAGLGYRVAESAAGRGVATAAVAGICRLAATAYRLTALTAVTTLDNRASRKVLTRNGFTRTGDTLVGGRPGTAYLRHLGHLPPHAPHTSTPS
ncbi:GNAT family N-acetyltransferase [Streptomyces thermospinosisporus]|uniref:GNAT family N-acetyltransferase n=1 Tax=Streptomyces thermospinosisporus TaxID=161482 RepID=A0ABN1Z0C6_9ACTN